MVIALFLIWSLARRFQKNNPRIWKYQTHVEIVVLGLTLWLLKGPGRASYSATSLLALSLGLFVYGAFYYLKKKGKTIGSGVLMIVMALIIVYGITIVYTGEIKFGSLATGLGRNETFTDRTAIWARIIPVVKQKPIFGGGFGGFWTPQTRTLFRISGAHSGYLGYPIGARIHRHLSIYGLSIFVLQKGL